MLHGSETWPENEVSLWQAEMSGAMLQYRIPSKRLRLRERLGLDDIISVLQQIRLQWYGHVIQKEDNDWVKKCMEYEVEVPGQEVDHKENFERDCGKRLPGT